MGKTIPLPVRFAAKVDKQAGGCWRWTGATDPKSGYGRIYAAGRTTYAHRVAYELHIAPIPAGLQIDHLCRNRWCVNPAHLEPVTPMTNTRRSPVSHGSETQCPSGHAYEGDNLYVHTNKRGQERRYCKACRRASVARHYREHGRKSA